jgi:hypothetical protein
VSDILGKYHRQVTMVKYILHIRVDNNQWAATRLGSVSVLGGAVAVSVLRGLMDNGSDTDTRDGGHVSWALHGTSWPICSWQPAVSSCWTHT